MEPDQIRLTDWQRLLVGQAPFTFLIEVGLRALITYVILLVAMRLMGKRVAGQMSAVEITIVVTLGAAIGVPLQAPDRGMLPAIIILGVAVLYQRGINYWSYRSRRAELAFQGDVATLVRDGCLDLPALSGHVLSRERLFAMFRESGLVQLGQVKRAYLEADGHLSVYRNPKPPPGLSLLVGPDKKHFEEQFRVPDACVCNICGKVLRQPQPPGECPVCRQAYWSPAVEATEIEKLKSEEEMRQAH